MTGIEPVASSLPRKRSTPELRRRIFFTLSRKLNTSKAFRAGDQVRTGDIQLGRLTLYQLSYSRVYNLTNKSDNEIKGVGRAGFEPAKLKTTELQSVLVGRLSISPLYYQNSVRKTTY